MQFSTNYTNFVNVLNDSWLTRFSRSFDMLEITTTLFLAGLEIDSKQLEFLSFDQTYISTFKLIELYRNFKNHSVARQVDDFLDKHLGDLSDIALLISNNEVVDISSSTHLTVLIFDRMKGLRHLMSRIVQSETLIMRYFVLVIRFCDTKLITKIFKFMWTLKLLQNVHLVCHYGQQMDFVYLYSYQPFNESCHEHVEPYIAKIWSPKYKWSPLAKLRPKINLRQCPLVCGTWIDPVYLTVNDPLNGSFELVGIEGKLLEFIGYGMNFSHEMYYFHDHETVASIRKKKNFFYEVSFLLYLISL